MKDDHSATIRELALQLEKKNVEIDRLKKEKNEAVNNLNTKVNGLQDLVRNLEVVNDQCITHDENLID